MPSVFGALRRRALPALVAAALGTTALTAPMAQAQSTEERFHDLFVTAGYCTAFGAALGTAFLAFKEDPSQNLRFVAIGASLGFIGGSILGSYVIFSPMVQENGHVETGTLLSGGEALPENRLALRPTWDRTERRVSAVEGAMTLMTF